MRPVNDELLAGRVGASLVVGTKTKGKGQNPVNS